MSNEMTFKTTSLETALKAAYDACCSDDTLSRFEFGEEGIIVDEKHTSFFIGADSALVFNRCLNDRLTLRTYTPDTVAQDRHVWHCLIKQYNLTGKGYHRIESLAKMVDTLNQIDRDAALKDAENAELTVKQQAKRARKGRKPLAKKKAKHSQLVAPAKSDLGGDLEAVIVYNEFLNKDRSERQLFADYLEDVRTLPESPESESGKVCIAVDLLGENTEGQIVNLGESVSGDGVLIVKQEDFKQFALVFRGEEGEIISTLCFEACGLFDYEYEALSRGYIMASDSNVEDIIADINSENASQYNGIERYLEDIYTEIKKHVCLTRFSQEESDFEEMFEDVEVDDDAESDATRARHVNFDVVAVGADGVSVSIRHFPLDKFGRIIFPKAFLYNHTQINMYDEHGSLLESVTFDAEEVRFNKTFWKQGYAIKPRGFGKRFEIIKNINDLTMNARRVFYRAGDVVETSVDANGIPETLPRPVYPISANFNAVVRLLDDRDIELHCLEPMEVFRNRYERLSKSGKVHVLVYSEGSNPETDDPILDVKVKAKRIFVKGSSALTNEHAQLAGAPLFYLADKKLAKQLLAELHLETVSES